MKSDLLKLFYTIISWRILVFIFIGLAAVYLPLQKDFIGGGIINHIKNPYLWSTLNYDGEHYLSLSRDGYQPLTYFFFPVYPFLIKTLATIFHGEFLSYVYSGLFVSHFTFVLAVVGLWKLLSLDYDLKFKNTFILLLLLFPTSFFFSAFYTESLFLCLAVWSFYFARTKNWFLASVLASISTATRIIGVALVLALFVEAIYQMKKGGKFKFHINYLWLVLSPLGLIIYMFYLKDKTGDPLEFFHSITLFGQQRSTSFILPPQVFYRYIVKIIPNLTFYWPVVFTTFLEFFVGLLFFVLSILGFLRMRVSYAMYLALGYVIPVFSGSFSSLPRYVIILFPGFILMTYYYLKLNRITRTMVITLSFVLFALATGLFTQGYWIS